MAENKFVSGVIIPINGVITLLTCSEVVWFSGNS